MIIEKNTDFGMFHKHYTDVGLREAMIISASRRTDIPAFHGDWFFEHLKAGNVDVANPMNPHQIKQVSLMRDDVDCFVFWTKDISPMLPRLCELEGYPYYVQYTLDAYGADIETNVPPLNDRINALRALSDAASPDRVVWRYDPILLNAEHTAQFHVDNFYRIAQALKGYVQSVTISFVDYYKRIAKNWRKLGITEPTEYEVAFIAEALAAAARENGMKICACAEKYALSQYGIMPARCIDGELIRRITGKPIITRNAKSQRPLCGCSESVDIGAYGTCSHGCMYCYAGR